MNILIVPSWYEARPGAQLGSFFREQSFAIQAAGCNAIVADATFQSMHNLHEKEMFKIKKKNDEGLITYSLLIPSFGLLRFPRLGVSVYTRNLNRLFHSIISDGNKIDVIHAHSFFPAGVAATRIGKRYGIPVVVTEHSSDVISKKLTAPKMELLVETVENCNEFICVGNGLKNAVIEYTKTQKNLSVIPNMVDMRFTYKETKELGSFNFISIGNLIQRKRFDLTLQAFSLAFKGRSDVVLTIVGDGPLKDELKCLAKELNIENQVIFTGGLDRVSVAAELQKSRVFVLASDSETFGVVYIEALACGVPVIGTRNGGAEDIIDHNKGILVDTNSKQQLAEAMLNIYNNIELYNRKKLAEECQEQYGGGNISSRIIEVYKRCLDGEGSDRW
ncbi:MAG: glycosyltransferase family 4 protein [Ruminococcaceae bacterium]|nr:glycosyltransferase family 4 protein [Oscillospiraceae bacterium]